MSLARARAHARLTLAAAAAVGTLTAGIASAAPYASNVNVVGGTTVNFILNENADSLSYSINGGPALSLTPTKGTHSFSLGASSDTFSIFALKNDPIGFKIPTGGTIAAHGNGLSQDSAQGGTNQISDDSNTLVRFQSPRGIGISNDPNASNFGTAYISNSAAGATADAVRTLGDGLYAVRADQSDAFGYGNTAQDPGNRFDSVANSSSSPFRVSVGPGGDVYVADFSDLNGNVYRLDPTLTSGDQMFTTVGGPTPPTGQNHGSTTAVYVEGTLAGGNLTMYTVDEDLTTEIVTGSGATNDRNSIWRYDINGGPVPSSVTPTKVNGPNPLLPLATSDMDRGLVDGKFYLSQNRFAGNEPGLAVLSSDGQNLLFDSLSASRSLLGDPAAIDIFRNVLAMDVADDQSFMAVLLNVSDVVYVPLVNGIPDIANRLVIDTGTDVISGRDIAIDAAGNIHYVSSGQQHYRVLAPGGLSVNSLAFNGASYSFAQGGRSLYWDVNGTVAGAGGPSPSGVWNGSTPAFNYSATGVASLGIVGTTTSLDNVVFAAGSDATGAYTVTVSGTQAANSVAINQGTVNLTGGTIDTGNFNVNGSATANVSSVVTGGTLNRLHKSGTGTLNLTASNTYTGTTTVTGGTLQVNPAAAAPLLTGPGGTDIQFGRVVFDGGNAATIRSLLVTSYNGGTNAFQNGQIRSTTIQPNRALGYREAGGQVTVMYTVNGDANLSGDVSIADLNIAKANFGGAPDVWATGDFNYDGTTTIGDINTAKARFGQTLPLMAGGSSSRSASLQADGNAGPDSIELIVNVITGQCQMVGNDADPGEITSYEVRSLTGSLNAAGYTSLADQGRAGWGELPGTDFLVGEDHGFTADAVNATGFSLGNLFRPGQTQNLQFNYGDEQFNTIAGVVTYVPEPTTVTLLGLGALGLLGRRRRR